MAGPSVRAGHRQQVTSHNRVDRDLCLPGAPNHVADRHEDGGLRTRFPGRRPTDPALRVTDDDTQSDNTPEKGPPGSTLRVQSMGAFSVWRDGERIPDSAWRRRKVVALFKALLSAPDYQLHREQILELLWPERDPVQADSNLRFTLHKLRALLDLPDAQTSHIASRDRVLVLVPNTIERSPNVQTASPDWLDAAVFEAAAKHALAAQDPAACKVALSYYSGAYLPDDRYDDWILRRSEELAHLHLAVLLRHARLLGKSGTPDETESAWQHVLTLDPCHEEAAYALMRMLGESGRIGEALRVYAALASALQHELGVNPSAAIEKLRGRLVAYNLTNTSGTASAQPLSRAAPTDQSVPPSTNLPAALTSFVGRLHEQAVVRERLLQGRLLTLTGIGGSGKTRLAVQVAGTLSDHFPDGIRFVELATLTEPAGVPERVAGAVGMPDQDPGRPLLAGLRHYLHDRKLLLVLDNCEHSLDACANLVDALLNACPGLRILATSRECLDVAGELTFRVPPLSLPTQGLVVSPNQLLDYEAVQLFVERTQAHRPDFALTDRNCRAVHSICRRLDGLPLAIELAAARTRALSVESIDERLDQRFQLLTGGPRTAFPHHQTLRAALDWSYELLTPVEQVLLQRLTVFAGGWTLEAAEAICAGEPIGHWEVLDILSRLVNKSMVEMDEREDGVRYALQETMRYYAGEKLMAGEDPTQIYEKHLAWYLNPAEDGASGMLGPEQVFRLDRLTAEHDNLRAALSWSTAVETKRSSGPAAALRLAGALWRFWWMRGFPHEVSRWLELTLTAAVEAPPHLRARALAGAGVPAADQGNYRRARELHEESLALWRSLEDPNNVADALNNLGSVAQRQGDYREARRLHEESLALSRSHGKARGIARALNQLACIARDDQRDYPLASTLLEESLTLRRSLGNARAIAISLNNLGLVACYQGDYERARVLLEESLALRRSLGDARGIANSLGNLGRVAVGLGDHGTGQSLYQQSPALRRDQGDRRGIVECLEGPAMVTALKQQPIRATCLMGVAERLRGAIGFPHRRPIRDSPDQVLSRTRLKLGEAAFAAWRAGWEMAPDRAVRFASKTADGDCSPTLEQETADPVGGPHPVSIQHSDTGYLSRQKHVERVCVMDEIRDPRSAARRREDVPSHLRLQQAPGREGRRSDDGAGASGEPLDVQYTQAPYCGYEPGVGVSPICAEGLEGVQIPLTCMHDADGSHLEARAALEYPEEDVCPRNM